MGMFGGGGGGGIDVSKGVNAIKEGTQQGLGALQKYYQEGVGYLNQGQQNAQSYLAPYGVAGSTALDELYDTLGMARPQAGSFALQQALLNQDALNKKMGIGVTPDPSGLPEGTHVLSNGVVVTADQWIDPNTFHSDGKGNLINFTPGIYDGTPQLIFDPVKGRMTLGGGNNQRVDPNQYGLQSLQGNETYEQAMDPGFSFASGGAGLGHRLVEMGRKVTGTTGSATNLTPEEQAQWDLIQKYKSGNIGMTDPAATQAGVLSQLQNTPGYQFLMNQGLQGVDRSAAANGLLGSGAAIKQADRYASGLAEQTYNQRVQSLSAAAGAGQQAMNSQQTNAGALGSALATLGGNLGSNMASLYGSQSSGLAGLYGAQAAAEAQSNASSNGMFGSLAGGILGMFSDIRLKKDIIPTGEFIHDVLPVYEFSYVWDKDERHIGVMAQDVLNVLPEAVSLSDDGYYKVDYSKLGGL